jgi:hypothetical protein
MLAYEVISEADDPIVHEGSVYVRDRSSMK